MVWEGWKTREETAWSNWERELSAKTKGQSPLRFISFFQSMLVVSSSSNRLSDDALAPLD